MGNSRLDGLPEPQSSALYEAHALDQNHADFEPGCDGSLHRGGESAGGSASDSASTHDRFDQAVKRAIDIQVSATLLVLLLPFLIVMGLIVMSDGGAPMFGHQRVGIGGRRFKCLKFRSMVPHSEVVLEQLLASDPQARAEWNREFKLKNDIRVTKFGRLMRNTSLDELPQLWNVLRGEMSLVGPRPIVEKELPRYGASLRYYLGVKPGMTGLWQVSGRNDVDYATRVALDVEYARTRSLALDVSILLRTFKVVIARDGAY